ncbi:MAG TPA: hypothetical protein VGK74_24465, partial [Symbiobacteriaceae bacterium]
IPLTLVKNDPASSADIGQHLGDVFQAACAARLLPSRRWSTFFLEQSQEFMSPQISTDYTGSGFTGRFASSPDLQAPARLCHTGMSPDAWK